jgi:RimJ/RimL family protein N-acetyltransferase
MTAFPIDRAHPPRRLVYAGDDGVLVLRPWCLDDVEPIVVAIEASRADLRGFMPWAHGPVTRETHYEVLARFHADYFAGKDQALGIFSPANEVLGGVGFHPRTPLNPKALEVGYWGHSAHAGRGNVTRGVRVLIALAFDFFGVDRLQVMHDEANAASRRVVEKCGFVFEGTMRNVTLAPTPELVAGGLKVSGRTRMYALCPEDLASLAWLGGVRDSLEIEDALGERRRWPDLASR